MINFEKKCYGNNKTKKIKKHKGDTIFTWFNLNARFTSTREGRILCIVENKLHTQNFLVQTKNYLLKPNPPKLQ